ncbi:hypothetical protein RHS01_06682 [Rhizoctonia solani]|uniref:Uncharacterized protein n=1 Tax=Rhizoctonia solani TaxID=456999 RepID=A0A8H7IB48_9AGAM|nr:hypothetical protein RHS01_06682 [Rhizoctonia solani]
MPMTTQLPAMASHQKCYPLKYMMPELEFPMEDLKPIQDAIAQGDNLANTPAILEARVSRRALLHDMDARNLLSAHGASLYLPTTPSDAVRVYRMLLDRGYEKHNIRVQVERVHKNPETTLITEWRYPMLGEEIEELFRSDDHSKISDYVCLYFSPALFPSLRAAQELYAVLAKLLKGCTLTMSLDIKMERIDEPELFKDVKAKIFMWSGYNTLKDRVGGFASVGTLGAVQEVEGTVSNAALYENVKQRVVAKGGSDVQLWVSDDGSEAAPCILDDLFVM